MNQKLWVLDFDRCLGDVEALYSQLEKVIDARGFLPVLEMKRMRNEVEQSGGSFNALAACKERLSEERYQQLLAMYSEEQFPMGYFLLPGAQRFLDWLRATRQPYMIMTYGESDWQLAKLQRAGLSEVAYMITTNFQKVGVIGGWYTEQEVEIPAAEVMHGETLPSAADEVILVDDKAKAFSGAMPPKLRGYWLQHGPLIMSQTGEVPRNVTTVQSFDEIIELETHST